MLSKITSPSLAMKAWFSHMNIRSVVLMRAGIAASLVALAGAVIVFTDAKIVLTSSAEEGVANASDSQPMAVPVAAPADTNALAWEQIRISSSKKGAFIAWSLVKPEEGTTFVVERSATGEMFKPVAEVSMKVTTRHFSFEDTEIPALGWTVASYRIRAHRSNGSIFVSPVKELRMIQGITDMKLNLIQPSDREVLVSAEGTSSKTPVLSLLKASGEKMSEIAFEGRNDTLKIPISGWAKGVYYFRLTDDLRELQKVLVIE
jgi:hypothetical protein